MFDMVFLHVFLSIVKFQNGGCVLEIYSVQFFVKFYSIINTNDNDT